MQSCRALRAFIPVVDRTLKQAWRQRNFQAEQNTVIERRALPLTRPTRGPRFPENAREVRIQSFLKRKKGRFCEPLKITQKGRLEDCLVSPNDLSTY